MLVTVAAALVLHADSLVGTWQYRAFSQEGKLIASGPIQFRPFDERGAKSTRRPLGWTHTGTRRVTEVDPSAYGPHSEKVPGEGERKLTVGARIEKDGSFHADMSMGWNDHNIVLNGKRTGKQIDGTWTWNTFAGARARGRFMLTRASASGSLPK